MMLGALNWSVQWYKPKQGASLDELTEQAMQLFLPRHPDGDRDERPRHLHPHGPEHGPGLAGHHGEFKPFSQRLPDRILAHLKLLDGDYGGFPIDRYSHCLQTATLALRDGRDEEGFIAPYVNPAFDVKGEILPIGEFASMSRRVFAQPRNSICKAALEQQGAPA